MQSSARSINADDDKDRQLRWAEDYAVKKAGRKPRLQRKLISIDESVESLRHKHNKYRYSYRVLMLRYKKY